MKRKLMMLSLMIAMMLSKAHKAMADSVDVARTVAALVPLDMHRVNQISGMLSAGPAGFGKNYHDRQQWDKLAKEKAYQQVIVAAEALLNKPFPAWNTQQYMLYFTKGTRPEGEQMMSARSSWLAPLVWAECIENKGRFVPAIEMVLKELIHQPTWTLPAHDKFKQNIEGRYYTVDLGAAVLANNIAQAVYLLDDKIKPELRADILQQMYQHVFNPVLKSIATGNNEQYWLTWTNNWNSVCLAGVTGAALAIIPERTERAKFVTIAERYSKNSIAGFTDEGYCMEGLGYYAYGFGHYILLREDVLQATGGKLDLFADPKIKRIAAYAPNLEIMNDVYPAIADSHAGLKAPQELLWYCSRALKMGLHKYDTLTVGGRATNLVEDVMYAFPNSVSESYVADAGSHLAPGLRSYFKEAGVLIERPAAGSSANIGAALQGGTNAETHNHNDVGSYSIVVGDEMLMGDPGGPFVYTAKTFGPERYSYKILSSYGHPVPLAGVKQQVDGPRAQALILKTDFTDQQDVFAMDIASAYPGSGLTKLIRTFTYDRTGVGALSVTDDFKFTESRDFELALITRAKWRQIGPHQIEFDGEKEKMIATISGQHNFKLKSEIIEENAPAFTRIAIILKPAAEGSITISFKPLTTK